jgi:tetratricopeptide (TPR) repeat protein
MMWERYNLAGQQAMTQGQFSEAEIQFRNAVHEGEKLGLNDPRLPMSLNNLANCLRQQGKYSDADPVYTRALELKTRQVGPFSTDLIPIMENFAKNLRAAGKEAEAAKLEKRAMAIFIAKK